VADVLFVADDSDVIGSKTDHASVRAHLNGLERWNSYENFSGLSTSLTTLTNDGTQCELFENKPKPT